MSAALFAFMGVIAAALANLYWNFRNAKALRKQPFLERQLELCLEVSTLAARLATVTDLAIFDSARSRFLELYWGPLSVMENSAVQKAMIEFEEHLSKPGGGSLPREDLALLSHALALEVRDLILEAWSIGSLGELLKRDACEAVPR